MSEEGEAPVGSIRTDPPTPWTSDDEFDENEGRLSWRTDPEESHSDWTIEILVGEQKIHGTYHVHKSMLSVRSQYFAHLLSNKNFSEHRTSTSRIELEELAAKAFPIMLDYLYSLWDDGKPPIMHENAVALHYLGGYFEVRGLRKKARDFWKKRIAPDHFAILYEHAKLFHDNKAYRSIVKKCRCSIYSIGLDSPLMEVSDAHFWLDILKENEPFLPFLSTLVSAFCSKQKEQLDAPMFVKLTDETVLPRLSAKAAIELLELEVFFLPATALTDELSNLQERCYEALNTLRKKNPRRFAVHQPRLKNPLVLQKLLTQASEETRLMLVELRKSEVKLRLQRFLPKRVVISGAGSPIVNGTYSRTGKFLHGAPGFFMDCRGVLGGFRCFVFLSSGEDEGVEPTWHISVRGDAESIGSDLPDSFPDSLLCVDLFTAKVSSNACILVPPSTGWTACHEGNSTVPTVDCHYN